jgi:threonine/homoserine/homoserine lactone efflux protein
MGARIRLYLTVLVLLVVAPGPSFVYVIHRGF